MKRLICNVDFYKNFKKGEDVSDYIRYIQTKISLTTCEYSAKEYLSEKYVKGKNDKVSLRHPKTGNVQLYSLKNFILK